MKSLVIIPTYNEADNITPLIARIRSILPDLEILVIDDASSDGTADLVRSIRRSAPDHVHLFERPGKLGLGTAYVQGFKWAIEKGFDAVIEMDADFSHDPANLPEMIAALHHHPVVIGSRYIEGGGTKNWGLLRRLISRFGSFYARLILGVPIHDVTGGFNGWQATVINTINPSTISSEGYAFQVELKYRAHLAGFPAKEFPITFVDRVAGTSKMSFRIGLEAMYRVWVMRFNANSYKQSALQALEEGGR